MTLEAQVAQELSDAGAPEDLAPQLVAIALDHGVPPKDLLCWIRQGQAETISGVECRKFCSLWIDGEV